MSEQPSGPRKALVERQTRETRIRVQVDLDGSGRSEVKTGIGFFDHMLELLARHGYLDLELEAEGDLETGAHHTVEDAGIALGVAFERAWGTKDGIARYATAHLPMDEALVMVSLDLSGRPYLAYAVDLPPVQIGGFDSVLAQEFLQALVANARVTCHVRQLAGTNPHHVVEAVFKGFGRALHDATRVVRPGGGAPSTKGIL